MTGIFLQVRINSTRLPGKALLDLPDGNVIQHAMRWLKKTEADIFALLTDDVSAPRLAPFAALEGYEVFQGPADDVLKRYCLAAEYFHVDRIVRATGDNPLVSAELTNRILEIHEREGADLSHFLGIPIGSGVEVVEHRALMKAERKSVDPFEREHLTTHLYRNRDSFHVIEAPCPREYYLPEVKISLDTEEDYRIIRQIYDDLYDHGPIETDDIIKWYKQHSGGDEVREKENRFCSQE